MSISELISPLNHVLFVIGSDHVSVAEVVGFVTGAWGVWLTVRARISNFPVGLANNVFFLVLFLNARLFADASLQVVYFVLGVAGWWAWLRLGPNRTDLSMSRSSPAMLLACLAAVPVVTLALIPALRSAHDIAPFLDAVTTGLSLAAQVLLNLKRIENWWAWIAADLIYVPLYVEKSLYLTAAVYGVFLVMCVAGMRSWQVEPSCVIRTKAMQMGAA